MHLFMRLLLYKDAARAKTYRARLDKRGSEYGKPSVAFTPEPLNLTKA